MTPRAAVYNRFWHSRGGGERYSGMVAQVLRASGADVELLGHSEVDTAALGSHLGLDLSGVTSRSVPDLGDAAMVEHSRDYDLFVNGSHMSRLEPVSARSVYVCYFPTPLDAGMSQWRRSLGRSAVGRYARGHRTLRREGWFTPEGGPRRQWTWTNGDGVLELPPGPERRLQMHVGRPGAAQGAQVVVEADSGAVLARLDVRPVFAPYRLRVPASEQPVRLHLRSPAAAPDGADTRRLGVAVSRLRVEGVSRGPRERLAERVPWLLPDAAGTGFLAAYDCVLAISEFTDEWVRRYWDVPTDRLPPPVQVDGLRPAARREPTILGLGRFFAPEHGHSKRQLEMVQAFGAGLRSGALPEGWRLVLIGGSEPAYASYVDDVRAAAEGLPVELHLNAPRSTVTEHLQTASVFWAATGLGDDVERSPWSQEHFGITTVEAMAGGCVPVVIDRAGQREIVRGGVDGFRWSTVEELVARTAQLCTDDDLRSRLSAAAVQRAREYDDAAFASRLREIIARRRLLEPR